MAQFESPTYVAQSTAAGNAAKLIDSAELISGKVSFLQCEVVVPAGTATNDTILVGFIPSAMTVIPGQVTLSAMVAAGANGVKIGTEADDDAISAEVVLNSANTTVAAKPTVASFTTTKRVPVVVTLASGALTAGGKFFINIPLVNSN